ncbi:MAG: hypothetical protein L3J74_13925, partial [Bacteroidales bacterium]|nr:hypothetical protein [Bacteroidales bacterium]
FGVKRNVSKDIEFRVVGLAESQSHKLKWVDYMGGSWQVMGNWLIHEGAENPTKQAWGALGCIEVCGENAWNKFNELLKSLTNVDDYNEMGKLELLTVEYLPAPRPALRIKK